MTLPIDSIKGKDSSPNLVSPSVLIPLQTIIDALDKLYGSCNFPCTDMDHDIDNTITKDWNSFLGQTTKDPLVTPIEHELTTNSLTPLKQASWKKIQWPKTAIILEEPLSTNMVGNKRTHPITNDDHGQVKEGDQKRSKLSNNHYSNNASMAEVAIHAC